MISTEVRATTIRIPLSSPIVMGPLRFDSREYLVVEVLTDQGVTGIGLGMTRDAPLAPILARNVAPRLIGADPLATEAIWERCHHENLTIGPARPVHALSERRRHRVVGHQGAGRRPALWQLLGGARDRIPASMAGGYPRPGVTLDTLGEEIAGYAAQGFPCIKIAAGPLAADTERLRVAAGAVGGSQLAYDAHGAWRTLPAVLPTVRRWTDSTSRSSRIRSHPTRRISPGSCTSGPGSRWALGEDITGRYAYRDLIAEAPPDVLRVDATTTGGLSEAIKICAGRRSVHPRPAPHLPGDPRP